MKPGITTESSTMTAVTPRTRILIVDDDEDFLFQHRIQLENAGFEVKTATSRAEAEAVAVDFRPDLAILDLMMEQHDDGFVLSHHLKRMLPGLPVVLVTAVTAETGLSFAPQSAASVPGWAPTRCWPSRSASSSCGARVERLLASRAGARTAV